jgi:LAGLIDADG DNA endonuclease family
MKKRKSKEKDADSVSLKSYRSFAFNSRAMFHDPRWRELFYAEEEKGRVKYRKSLPADLKDYFWGDLALAIWFLDDGWYDPPKKTVRFSCGEWTRSECAIMVECLKDNFNLDAVVYPMESSESPTKTPHHFYIKPQCYAEFSKRVEPFLKKLESLAEFPKYRQSISMKNKQLP